MNDQVPDPDFTAALEKSIEAVQKKGREAEAKIFQNFFALKDSGERQQFESGMQRDTSKEKPRFDLVFDGPMFTRFAEHLRKGAIKYSPRNWMKAEGPEEMERFRESAARHFAQWMRGDTDEDHAAAVFFNINGYEYVRERREEVR